MFVGSGGRGAEGGQSRSTSRTVDRLCPIPNCTAAAARERSWGVREGKEEKGEGGQST